MACSAATCAAPRTRTWDASSTSSSIAAARCARAVIDFGGFLGVGSRKIVVDWNALHFGRIANKSDSITLELTKEQVKAAPEYKEDTPIVVLGASGSLQPLQFDPLTIRRSNLFARSSRQPIDRIDDDRRDRPIGGDGVAAAGTGAGGARAAPAPSRAEPARPRLVHLLSCRCADRLRSVRRGLSDHAEMDPGRDRLRAVDRRHRRR